MDRTQNAVRNMSWGLMHKAIALLMPFLTRTVLIKVLGLEYLGLNSLFASVLSLLNLAELGVSSAIISTMYKPIEENDTETVCALMSLYRKAYYTIGIIIIVVGVLLMPFIPNLIEGDMPSDVNIYILFSIYLLNTSISYFFFAYKSCIFIAHQRNDVNSKVQTMCVVIQNMTQIAMVCLFTNYYCFVIFIPLFSMINNLVIAVLAKRAYPEYICKGTLDNQVKYEVKKRVIGLLLAKVSATVRSSIDSLFVSAMLGLKLVAMYSNYFYVVTAVAGIIQIIETSLVAGVGNSIVVATVEKNHHDFIKFTFMLQWIVAWCSISVLCLEQPFMKLWVGDDFMFKDTMVILCALYLFTSCICLIRSVYTQALGMWWTLKYLSIFDMFTNIFLNYFLGKHLGAYGILGATIIDIAFVSIPWTTYYLFREYFGISRYKKYMLSYVKYFCIAFFTGAATYGICSILAPQQPVLKLLISAIICIVFPNIIYFILFYRTQLFAESKAIILNKAFIKKGNK